MSREQDPSEDEVSIRYTYMSPGGFEWTVKLAGKYITSTRVRSLSDAPDGQFIAGTEVVIDEQTRRFIRVA